MPPLRYSLITQIIAYNNNEICIDLIRFLKIAYVWNLEVLNVLVENQKYLNTMFR